MGENEKADADARRLCASVRRITVTEHETRLAAHVERLLAEVERLREGKLTPDEFQNLCHNLKGNPDLTPEKFFDGCAVYQVALFGVCERDRLAKRVADLEAKVAKLREAAKYAGPGRNNLCHCCGYFTCSASCPVGAALKETQ